MTVRTLTVSLAVGMLLALTTLGPSAAQAARGDCGQPSTDGVGPAASDALFVLRVAVGLGQCGLAICDVDANCSINAVDALRLLKNVVGQAIELSCAGNCVTTTTVEEAPNWPEDPMDYVPGPISYLSELSIAPLDQGVPSCCKDFGAISKDAIVEGTDELDNALSVLANQLQPLGVDLNALLTDSITTGSLAVLFDHQSLDSISPALFRRGLAESFTLVQLGGIFADGSTYAEAAIGQGRFLMRQDSFVAGTAEPVNFAHPAQMGVEVMSAGPFTLDLVLPFGFLTLALPTEQTEVEANHGPIEAAGIAYSGGELSGFVRLDGIFDSINEILAAPGCACLGTTEPVYHQEIDGTWGADCVIDARTRCPGVEQDVCVILAGINVLADPPEVCLILPGVLSGAADLDLDSVPSTFEALSLGLNFTGVPGTLIGLEP